MKPGKFITRKHFRFNNPQAQLRYMWNRSRDLSHIEAFLEVLRVADEMGIALTKCVMKEQPTIKGEQ